MSGHRESIRPRPGPITPDLLCLQADHRSAGIYSGDIGDEPLTIHRCDGDFWFHTPIPATIFQYISMAGFEGVVRTGYIKLDHSLITSLVERWRQETHTFHLPVGEATVTLQDVAVLWGLPIDGLAVTGVDTKRSKEEWIQLCEDVLGFAPDHSCFDHGRLKTKCLASALAVPLPVDATDELFRQRARVYILLLLGGHLLSDKSGNKVPLFYIPLLADLETVGRYSWGSAVLATLYRSLCRASKADAREVSGPLVLLQLWAWERLPTMSPIRISTDDDDEDIRVGPRGARWHVSLSLFRTPTHVLAVYRDQLSRLRYDQFIWRPYSEDLLLALPAYCIAGRDIWRSVTPLICWEIVELHMAHRVLRQFGMVQVIPRQIDTGLDLHKLMRRGHQYTDWRSFHSVHLQMWDVRAQTVEQSDATPSLVDIDFPSVEYFQWYRDRTILHISRPNLQAQKREGFHGEADRSEYLMDVVHRMYHMSLEYLSESDAQHSAYFAKFRDICSDTIQYVGENMRMQVPPTVVLEDPSTSTRTDRHTGPIQRVPRIPRGRGRIGGRQRRVAPTESSSRAADHVTSTHVEHGGQSSSTATDPTNIAFGSPFTFADSNADGTSVPSPNFPSRSSMEFIHQHAESQSTLAGGDPSQPQEDTNDADDADEDDVDDEEDNEMVHDHAEDHPVEEDNENDEALQQNPMPRTSKRVKMTKKTKCCSSTDIPKKKTRPRMKNSNAQ